MQEYIVLNIGDIVRTRDIDECLFMIVDVCDYTEPSKHGEKPIVDIDYEMMQIYPISYNARYVTLSHNDTLLHASRESRNAMILMQMIKKDREKRGWFDIPDYIQVATRNSAVKKKKEKNEDTRSVKLLTTRLDVVRYDTINNVDECLDAINDLNELHKMFGDEAYIQLKELVINRIKKLQEV